MRNNSRALRKLGDEWKRENRERNVYPAPNDGREWMLVDEAAALYGMTPHSLMQKARELHWRRTQLHNVKSWLLKEDVMHYWNFLKDRKRWYKRRLPKSWIPQVDNLTGMEPERIKRVFWTSSQAAEYLGVSVHRISELARKGKLPVYVTNGMGKGRKCWFSPTNLQTLKEDEERLRLRAIWEKGKATMEQGIVAREVYNRHHQARTYKNVPPGWITIHEMADRLNINHSCAYQLRRRGRILCEQFTGEWDAKRRPWFVHEDSVEEYRATEHYQRTQAQGKAAALSVIGKREEPCVSEPSPSPETQGEGAHSELSFGYTHEELTPNWGKKPPSSLDIEW